MEYSGSRGKPRGRRRGSTTGERAGGLGVGGARRGAVRRGGGFGAGRRRGRLRGALRGAGAAPANTLHHELAELVAGGASGELGNCGDFCPGSCGNCGSISCPSSGNCGTTSGAGGGRAPNPDVGGRPVAAMIAAQRRAPSNEPAEMSKPNATVYRRRFRIFRIFAM